MRTETLIFSQLMLNIEYSRRVLPHIQEEYFSSSEDKIFFKIYTRYFKKHNVIPSKQAMLVEIENLKGSADVYKSLSEVLSQTETFTENLEYLITTTEKFVKERAIYNALREAVLIADGQDKKKTPEAIPSILQTALSVCFDTAVGHDYSADASARYDYYHLAEARIPTGISMFDEITKGGFPRKTLNVLLAPPHGGKSLVMVNVASGAAQAGHNVLYITMEMSEYEIGKRFDVNMMDMDFETLETITKPIFTNKFNSILHKARDKLVIKEFPTGGASASHFRALFGELKTKRNFVPDLVVIDYMGITASENYKPSSGANSYTILKSIGEELRALAIEYNCAVLTAVQTNRSGVGNSDIDMTNISESLGTVMIADWMVAIINTDELKQLKQLMFRQLKNRYKNLDEPNKFLTGVDYSKMKLFDLEESTVKYKPKKPPKIETAVDTFSDIPIITPAKSSFDDFNFDD